MKPPARPQKAVARPNSCVVGHGVPLFVERKGEDEGESCRCTAGSTTECRLRKRQRGTKAKPSASADGFCCLSCCPARKSCRKRTACGMRYSCAKFVKYDLRVGLARVAGCGRVSADTQRCRSTTTTRMGDKAKPLVVRRLCSESPISRVWLEGWRQTIWLSSFASTCQVRAGLPAAASNLVQSTLLDRRRATRTCAGKLLPGQETGREVQAIWGAMETYSTDGRAHGPWP